MNNPDLINGLFESFGASVLWLNINRLIKDEYIAGVSIFPTMFYSVWGFWNLYYYPHLNQWYSFIGALGVVIANTVWTLLAIYYKRDHARRMKKYWKMPTSKHFGAQNDSKG